MSIIEHNYIDFIVPKLGALEREIIFYRFTFFIFFCYNFKQAKVFCMFLMDNNKQGSSLLFFCYPQKP